MILLKNGSPWDVPCSKRTTVRVRWDGGLWSAASQGQEWGVSRVFKQGHRNQAALARPAPLVSIRSPLRYELPCTWPHLSCTGQVQGTGQVLNRQSLALAW